MRHIKPVIYFLLPSVYCFILGYVFVFADNLSILSLFLYPLTLFHILRFTYYKRSHMWILPVSFLITPVPIHVCAAMGGGLFWEILVGLGILFYALPFFLISTIIALVVRAKDKKRNRLRNHLPYCTNCKSEWRKGLSVCPDCGGKLIFTTEEPHD